MLLLITQLHAEVNPPEWTTPIEPFRIAGNLYYVGSMDLASYLIVTPKGNILINPSLEVSVPLIRSSVEELGFRFEDIKILLISHAHWDHDAGSAEVKRLTGAQYMVMDGDVPSSRVGERRILRILTIGTPWRRSIGFFAMGTRYASAAPFSWLTRLPDILEDARRGRCAKRRAGDSSTWSSWEAGM
jgi:glyoxylase-like metal-dependent hydrolase (beta-lactamase superfamily II)